MPVWAIADLHLSFGVPDKQMDVFGANWADWTQRIESHWKSMIKDDDLVLIPGDISWAMKVEDAVPDLQWIHSLPGTKLLLRGNHDYWWTSLSKIEKVLPPSIHLIQNNSFVWKDIAIGGARLWDSSEFGFSQYINYQDNPKSKKLTEVDHNQAEAEKVFLRELGRLELSLKSLPKDAAKRIIMTHYPPIGADLKPSRASKMLEENKVDICVFGHLHNVKPGLPMFGTKNHVKYYLTSCDYLNFIPIKVLE